MFFRTTLLRAGLLLALVISTTTLARAQSLGAISQEVELLRQQVGQLQLTVEALQREVSETRAAAGRQNYATVKQLNDSIADLNRLIKDSGAATKADTLRTVSAQMDKLVKQTNDALADMAKNVNAGRRSAGNTTTVKPPPTFSDNYPKEGVSYTVQPGDTIGKIAQKTGSKVRDIINANRIADETKLMIGQVLFVPGAKVPEPPSPVAPAAN